jgi:hypothetical protein
LIVSDALVQASDQTDAELSLKNLGKQQLKGRGEPIEIWGLDPQASDLA